MTSAVTSTPSANPVIKIFAFVEKNDNLIGIVGVTIAALGAILYLYPGLGVLSTIAYGISFLGIELFSFSVGVKLGRFLIELSLRKEIPNVYESGNVIAGLDFFRKKGFNPKGYGIGDINDFAKICAEKQPLSFLCRLNCFIEAGLNKNILEIIEILSKKEESNHTPFMPEWRDQFLPLLNEEEVLKYAKIGAEISPFQMSSGFHVFMKKGLSFSGLLEAAKIIGKNTGLFSIYSRQSLILISQKKSLPDFYAWIEMLKEYLPFVIEFTDVDKFLKELPKNEIFDYAQLLAKHFPSRAIDSLDKFAANLNEDHFLKLSFSLAKKNPNLAAERIDKFAKSGFDSVQIKKMAQLFSKSKPELLVDNIHKFKDAGLSQDFIYSFAVQLTEEEPLLLIQNLDKFEKTGLKLDEKFIEEFPDQSLAPYAAFLKQFNNDQLSVVKKALPFIEDFPIKNKLKFILLLHAIPEKEHQDLLASITPFLENREAYNLTFLLKIAILFPVKSHQSIFNLITPVIKGPRVKKPSLKRSFIFIISNATTDQRDDCFFHMKKRLETFRTPSFAIGWANFLLNFYEVFFDGDHPLFLTILEILFGNDAENPKNPVRIYKELKALSKEPSIFIPPLMESVNGEKLTYQLERFSKQFKPIFYTVKDLPEEVGSDTLNDLFTALEKRLQEMDPHQRDEAEKYIVTVTKKSFQDLKQHITSDQFLKNLLRAKQSDLPVSKYAYRLFHILGYLLKKSDQVDPENLFTEREEALIQISNLLLPCNIGKQEAIDLIFDQLNLGQLEKVEKGSSQHALRFIHRIINKKISALFSFSSQFIEEVVDQKEVKQGNHQTTYLKNLLVGRIPIDFHHVIHDPSTEMLYNSLIPQAGENEAKRLEKYKEIQARVLKILYDYLPSPKSFISEFKKAVDERIKNEEDKGMEKGERGLYFAIENLCSERKYSLKPDEIWKVEDNTRLSIKGAQEILILAGLFSREEANPSISS